jgi:DNA-binding response OmpR family regulator
MRVLLVEDDQRLGCAVRDVLRMHGMDVDRATTGEQAMELLAPATDVVVLDLTLPDRDGFDVCRRIRLVSDAPIVMATARGDLTSRVHGLHLGADDYLVKPYDVRELMARLHAVNRRARREEDRPVPVTTGRVTIDVERRVVSRDGVEVALTRKEFDLLALLARAPGVVFRHDQILSEVWQSAHHGSHRTLEVHVASVRAKTVPEVIETVRGVGYRLGR